MPKITKRIVDAIKPDDLGRDRFIWDSELRGFGVRVKASGAATYFVQYRNKEGRTRRIRVGRVGTLTPDEARSLGRQTLADVERGMDPSAERHQARRSITVTGLCDWYLKEADGRVKASTLAMDRSRIERHVKPLIGRLTVNSLTRADLSKLQSDIAAGKTAEKLKLDGRGGRATGGKGVAARTLGMVGTILEFAKKHGIITENPARGIEKYPDQKRRRFLSHEELEALGKAMREAVMVRDSDTGVMALRVLALTGCRRMEILALKWSEVDLKASCLRLRDTKSGAQLRPIGARALEVLKDQPRAEGSPFVFPADRGAGHFIGLPRVLQRLCRKAGLEDVSVHTFRHTFAATAAELGFSELTIAGLLGHRVPGVTARYAHMPDRALVSAATQVAAAISEALRGERSPSNVVAISG